MSLDFTRRDRMARRAVALSLIAYLGISGLVVWRSAVLQPYSDMLDWLGRYLALQADGDWSAYFAPPHNMHHLIITLGVLAADAQWFGAHGYLFVGVGALCIALTAVVLAVEARRSAPPGLRLEAAVLAAMAVLMSGNLLDASIHINTTYVHALLFAVLAIVLNEAGAPLRHPWRRHGLVLLCLFASAFGNAVGLAAWPVLLIAAIRGRAGWGWSAGLAAIGGVFIWLYFKDQPTLLAAPATRDGGGILDQMQLFLTYLGLPWTRGAPKLGWVVGAGVLASSAWAVATKGRAGHPGAVRVAVSLILFSLGTAAMAALGRVGAQEPWNVPLRYAVFMSPLYVGHLMLIMPALARIRRQHSDLVGGALAVCAGLMVVLQIGTGVMAVRTADVNRAMIDQFRHGVRTPQMTATIYPDLDRAAAVESELRARGLYQREWHVTQSQGFPN